MCDNCYWEVRASKKVLQLETELQHEWARIQFRKFVYALIDEGAPKQAALRAERHFAFWRMLDQHCDTSSQVTYELLVRHLHANELFRHRRSISHLIKNGILPKLGAMEWQYLNEKCAQRRLLEASTSEWFGSVLDAYYEHQLSVARRYERRGWTGEKMRPRPRTITSNLYAARVFLRHIPIDRAELLRKVTQDDLDNFISVHQGYANALRPFIRYLNEEIRLFRRIRIEMTKRPMHDNPFISTGDAQKLVEQWLSAQGHATKAALILLLMLVFAQAPRKVAALKLTDLAECPDGTYTVTLGSVDIPLDPRPSALVRRWLGERRSIEKAHGLSSNEFLFPGRVYGTHISLGTISEYVKGAKLSVKTLFSAAMFNAFANGIEIPKVAVAAFGVSMPSALKYWAAVDPRITAEVKEALRQLA